MKKLLVLVAIVCSMATLQAHPVDVETARLAGRQFIAKTFHNYSQNSDLQLVHTAVSHRGEACFFVFNVGENGFVMVSADDRFRPIVGYSDEGPFTTENPSPEMMFYLDRIVEARTSDHPVLYDDAKEEWKALTTGGKPLSRNGGKGVPYLCQTKWNQDSPYNLYAPVASSGPGGRCYAGCVATAMSQVMKYWDHPLTGSGSHSYYSPYGYLSANFGATTYDWDHMPDRLGGSSTEEEIDAVALLMYHCGVAVDMGFGPNGSGANSEDVPRVIRTYFSYTNQSELKYRDFYSLTQWQVMLKEQFDRGWPVYYSGYNSSGGHAFVCDGYDDNDLFHYNWGWGGNSDGWFVIDEIDYAGWAAAVINYVPTNVYQYMPLAPTNFTVQSLGDPDFSAVLSWTNPSQNIHGNALSSIDQVIITRNGKVIHTFDNPAPGAAMTFTDHYLPTMVSYSVYAVAHSAKGVEAKEEQVFLGPSCPWTIEMSSSDASGWGGGSVSVFDGMGVEIAQLSPSTASQTLSFEMPFCQVSFFWNPPTQSVSQLSFRIHDTSNERSITFDGASNDLKKGVFYKVDMACENGVNDFVPSKLNAELRTDDVFLQWEVGAGFSGKFFIYRDGRLYDMSESPSYIDADGAGKFHSYRVSSFDGVAESALSNSSNTQPHSDCEAPSNLRYEMTNNNKKVKLMWDAAQDENVGTYMVFRRSPGSDFKQIKIVTSTTYSDNIGSTACEVYDYAVAAYYVSPTRISAYANALGDPTLNYVSVNKTVIPMNLGCDVMPEGVTLSWLPALMANRYEVYRNGVLLADNLTESLYLDATAQQNQTYCYTVVGRNDFLTSNESNRVCVDWATMEVQDHETTARLYPVPAREEVTVSAEGLQQVTVYHLTGQVVLRQAASSHQVTLSIANLPQGTYFVEIQTEKGNLTEKLLKY